jgi:hypothetical protein
MWNTRSTFRVDPVFQVHVLKFRVDFRCIVLFSIMKVWNTLKRQVTEEGLRGKSSKKDLLEELLAEREYVCAQTTYEYGKSIIKSKSYL